MVELLVQHDEIDRLQDYYGLAMINNIGVKKYATTWPMSNWRLSVVSDKEMNYICYLIQT